MLYLEKKAVRSKPAANDYSDGEEVRVDLLGLMRQGCLVSDTELARHGAAQLLLALQAIASPTTRQYGSGDALIDSLIALSSSRRSLLFCGDPRAPRSVQEAVRSLQTLARLFPPLPPNDCALLSSLDEYILTRIEPAAPELLPLLVDKLAIPDRLPLIDEVLSEFNGGVDLSDYFLIAAQHLLGSSVPVFDALAQLGLPYEHMFIVGKAYSAHRLVVWELRRRGAWVHQGSVDYEGATAGQYGTDYRQELARDIKEALNQVLSSFKKQSAYARKRARILILDDGGQVIAAACTFLKSGRDPALSPDQLVAVEQTRKGIHEIAQQDKAKGAGVPISVVNVAESPSKLQLESPLIGKSIVELTMQRLRRAPPGETLRDTTAVVVGFGSVGMAVARECRARSASRVIVYDVAPENLANAKKEGFHPVPTLGSALEEGDLFFGCTGQSSMCGNMLNNLKSGAMLASGSTSNTEFLALYENVDAEPVQIEWDWPSRWRHVHSNHVLPHRNKIIRVLNAGFPINFDGSVDPIAPSSIQLTRALMLAGAIQAATVKTQYGLVPLQPRYNVFLARVFRDIARSTIDTA